MKAIEIMTTANCPLNCKYCYIPKTKYMSILQKKIDEYLQSDDLIKYLKKAGKDELEIISFWGAEPLVNLELMTKRIKEFKEEFPNFYRIEFSTSLILKPTKIIELLKECSKNDIKLGVQVSIDGPAYITNENRMKNAFETIEKNLYYLLDETNKLDLNNELNLRFKPTWSIDNIRTMNESSENFDKMIDWSNNWAKKFKEYSTNDNVVFKSTKQYSTLVVPGKYTSDDGKQFAKLIKKMHERGVMNTYDSRLNRVIRFRNEMYKSRMFTCSGGDSNMGLDENNAHICHRTFYLNSKEYVKSVMEEKDTENWDVSVFEQGYLDYINESYISDMNDELDYTRWKYVMRGYHDFYKLFINNIIAYLKQMALAGQVDKRYLYDDGLCILFAYFARSSLNCPMEQILNSGSPHLFPISQIRMFCNGAFQELLKERINSDISKRK